MTVMILAHGGHFAMFLMPVAAAIYLMIALRDSPKTKNRGTPVLPRNSFGRQLHHAVSPQKTKKPTATPPPVPSRFAPPRGKKRGRGIVVPLHGTPPPHQGSDSSSLPSAWNQ
jgi:hypothetical protein